MQFTIHTVNDEGELQPVFPEQAASPQELITNLRGYPQWWNDHLPQVSANIPAQEGPLRDWLILRAFLTQNWISGGAWPITGPSDELAFLHHALTELLPSPFQHNIDLISTGGEITTILDSKRYLAPPSYIALSDLYHAAQGIHHHVEAIHEEKKRREYQSR